MSNIIMSAPPVWYDGKENLVKILTGIQNTQKTPEIDNIVIGVSRYYETDYGNPNTVDDKSTIIGSVINHKFPNVTIENTCMINSVYVATENDSETVSNCCLINSSIDFGNSTHTISNVIAIGVQSGGIGDTRKNIVQIGSRNVQYTAQIGDGTGELKCVATSAISAQKATTTDFTNGEWETVSASQSATPIVANGETLTVQIVAFGDSNTYSGFLCIGMDQKDSRTTLYADGEISIQAYSIKKQTLDQRTMYELSVTKRTSANSSVKIDFKARKIS